MLKLICKKILKILCSNIYDDNFICPIFRFGNKEHAAQAICGVHGQVIMEQQVKCSWGKESNDPGQSQSSTPQMVAGNQSVSVIIDTLCFSYDPPPPNKGKGDISFLCFSCGSC